MGIVRSKYYGIIRGVTVGISFFFTDWPDDFSGDVFDEIFNHCVFIFEIVSVITVFALVNNAESYKMSWIVIILVLPVSGLFCILCGGASASIPVISGGRVKLMPRWSKISGRTRRLFRIWSGSIPIKCRSAAISEKKDFRSITTPMPRILVWGRKCLRR